VDIGRQVAIEQPDTRRGLRVDLAGTFDGKLQVAGIDVDEVEGEIEMRDTGGEDRR